MRKHVHYIVITYKRRCISMNICFKQLSRLAFGFIAAVAIAVSLPTYVSASLVIGREAQGGLSSHMHGEGWDWNPLLRTLRLDSGFGGEIIYFENSWALITIEVNGSVHIDVPRDSLGIYLHDSRVHIRGDTLVFNVRSATSQAMRTSDDMRLYNGVRVLAYAEYGLAAHDLFIARSIQLWDGSYIDVRTRGANDNGSNNDTNDDDDNDYAEDPDSDDSDLYDPDLDDSDSNDNNSDDSGSSDYNSGDYNSGDSDSGDSNSDDSSESDSSYAGDSDENDSDPPHNGNAPTLPLPPNIPLPPIGTEPRESSSQRRSPSTIPIPPPAQQPARTHQDRVAHHSYIQHAIEQSAYVKLNYGDVVLRIGIEDLKTIAESYSIQLSVLPRTPDEIKRAGLHIHTGVELIQVDLVSDGHSLGPLSGSALYITASQNKAVLIDELPLVVTPRYYSDNNVFVFGPHALGVFALASEVVFEEVQLSVAPLGSYSEQGAILVGGYTLVPVRFVSEELGANVKWVEEYQTVIVTGQGLELRLVIGMNLPGTGVAPMLLNDRTMIPIRHISESLGSGVRWNEDYQTVSIYRWTIR